MPNENEQILEAMLQNQDEKLEETNDLLEKVLEQTADNNVEDLLEKQLEMQSYILDEQKAILKSLDKPADSMIIDIKFEIVGGEAELIEVEDEKND